MARAVRKNYRTHFSLLAASVAMIAAVSPHAANADWVASSLDQRCHPDDISGVSENVRSAIEAAVRRAEASIQAPAGVADLGCLNDLMSAPIDIFSNVGSVMGALQGGVFDSLSFPMDMDVSGMLCDFAAEKWGNLTEGLDGMSATMSQFANTPASLVDRIAGGGGFGSGPSGTGSTGRLNFNLPNTSGVSYENNTTGTVPVEISIPRRPDPVPPVFYDDSDGFNEAAFSSAIASYEAEVQNRNLEYSSCLTSRAVIQGLNASNPSGFTSPVPVCTAPVMPVAPQPEAFRTASPTFVPFTAPVAPAPSAPPVQQVNPQSLIGTGQSTPSVTGGQISPIQNSIQSIWGNM